MKNKKIILATAAIINGIICFGQKMHDVIYLNNGGVIHGQILEQPQEDLIKIKNKSGDIFVYNRSEVKEIKNEEIPKREFDVKKKGYYSTLNSALLIGSDNYGSRQSLSITNVHNYMLKSGLSFGIGTGIEWLNTTIIPVFTEISYYPFSKRKSPFISVQGGFSFPFMNNNYSPVGIWENNYSGYKGGYMGSVTIGTRRYIGNNTALILGVGYRYQEMHYTSYDWIGNVYTADKYINRLSLKLGFAFM